MPTLAEDLAATVKGEVRFDDGSRAAYSTDASNFRQVPIGVVVPATVEDGAEAVRICRDHGAPLLSRGGGTSLAGQCTNEAVVIDWSKYCNRLLSVDVDARTCIVEPGIVLDDLNDALAAHGLRFGPEPATHPTCTIGGMIGNNSCGATAQRTGKVVDNIARLEVLLYDGTRFWCGETAEAEYREIERHGDRRAAIYRRLRRLVDDYRVDIERGYPQIPRRVSGYNLDSLLPEHHFDVAGLLVGSESTLVTVLRAELELVPRLSERVLVVLGFPDIASAADAVPDVLPYAPVALEGLDHRLVVDQRTKHMNPHALESLPAGRAFLMVQFGSESHDEAVVQARALADAFRNSGNAAGVKLLEEPDSQQALWRVREAGLAATARVPGERDTWPGWEDSAVAPEDLGDYLRDLEKLCEKFGFADDKEPSLYGHFGQGCLHTSIPFELSTAQGVSAYRTFLEESADLVTRYGGSLSGEHGDGQGRGELLSRMFGPSLMHAFVELKTLFDPHDRMNPGKLVKPRPLDANLRLGPQWSPQVQDGTFFAYSADDGSFTRAVTRCVGVGKCRQHEHPAGAVMCPSYQATREEEHATRGRARLLFEMLGGHQDSPIGDGWRSKDVLQALDLCLACKGCKSDCPVNVDMATYKAEFLAHHYAGRIRPRSHFALGWLPLYAAAVSSAHLARPVNALAAIPPVARAGERMAGLEARDIPRFAPQSFQRWHRRRREPAAKARSVLLWPDTFTNYFHPHVARAAVEVLEHAGWDVTVPQERLCCGLTWISTGQLKTATKVLRRTVNMLSEHLRAGGLVVGLEPSCTAVFRSDLVELLPHDLDARRLASSTRTLAELLMNDTPDWAPPDLTATNAIAQVHCHHHAVMGWTPDRELLTKCGVDVERLDSGCCGLAGNFGFEKGHLEISRKLAESVLVPAVQHADATTWILADGFSCRTQIREFADGRGARHIAELLASALTPAPRTATDGSTTDYGGTHDTHIDGSTLRRRSRRRRY